MQRAHQSQGPSSELAAARPQSPIPFGFHQVAPAELEGVLLSSPRIDDAAVTSVPHEGSGEAPRAFVVRADATLTSADVERWVAERVAPYKRLTGGVEFVASIPKSPSGKILRRLLRTPSKL